MNLEVKKWGDSKILVLPPHYIKYINIEVGDWLDISDAILSKSKEEIKNGRTKNRN